MRRSIGALILVCVCGAGGCAGDGPTIVTASVPDGRVRMAYSATLEADPADVTWALVAGALPTGVALGADGRLTGEPLESGTFGFTVEAAADDGADEIELQLHVPHVVLMSGFGPFAGVPDNPSIRALEPLDEQIVAGVDVRVVELPVTWDVSWSLLEPEIERLKPVAVVGTGVAGSDAMRVETLARNVQYGADVEGESRNGQPVVAGAPGTLDTLLPAEAIFDAMTEAGHDTITSDDAGSYLCNHVFYHLVYYAGAHPPLAAGFIHVPPVPDSTRFTVEDITAAQRAGLGALAAWLAARPRSLAVPHIDTHEPPVYTW